MKYGLKFYCEAPIRLPVNYNKILQAAVLNWIDGGDYSRFLHDEGLSFNNRKYKLFTFSNLMGNYVYDSKSKTLTFTDEIRLVLSFYSAESHKCIINNIRSEKPIKFGDSYGRFEECAIAEEIYESCVVDTMSPITVHSTMLKNDGGKFTYYYEPSESGFGRLIADNLARKIAAVGGIKNESDVFCIRPHKSVRPKRIVTSYGGMTVKAWTGRFEIWGSAETLKMALLAGVGDKNSIGFGCILQNSFYSNIKTNEGEII